MQVSSEALKRNIWTIAYTIPNFKGDTSYLGIVTFCRLIKKEFQLNLKAKLLEGFYHYYYMRT